MPADKSSVSRGVTMKGRPVWLEKGWSEWVGLCKVLILREKEEIWCIYFVNIKSTKNACYTDLLSVNHLRQIRVMKTTSDRKSRTRKFIPALTMNS